MTESFSAWACDPARTLEERYGAQRLIEHFTGLPVARDSNGHPNYEAARLWRKERALNPAYEPDFTPAMAREVEPKLVGLKQLDRTAHGEERPVRDFSFLRFCPALEVLHIGETEVADWSPLAGLKELQELWIGDRVACDLRPIGELPKLRTLRLFLHCPWPDLSGWDRLQALRELHFFGNPLALQVIGRLPAVRVAEIHHWLDYRVPLRSLHDLPEMPELRRLELINTWRLDGIERWPRLLNAEIYGYFDDLSPLTALQHCTHLTIGGGEYSSLAPLVRMASLHGLKVRREEPQDYSVLAEMPELHEVEVELCPASQVEVAALNAGLRPWGEIFAAEPPRPLAPLRLLLDRKDDEPADDTGRVPRDWGEDEGMSRAEARWFAREVNRRLNARLGKGWGKVDTIYCRHPGHEHVTISRPEDIDQLREVVDELRRLIASARHPWRCALQVDTFARYERDLDELDDEEDDEEEFNAERERAEWEDRQQRMRERREFLERQYRLRLQQELGAKIEPSDFAPPPPEPPTDEPETVGGDDGVEDEPEYDLGTELHVFLIVLERGCFVPEHCRGLAEMLLDLRAEEPGENEG